MSMMLPYLAEHGECAASSDRLGRGEPGADRERQRSGDAWDNRLVKAGVRGETVDARKQVVALERAGPSKQLDEARAEYKKAKADWEPHRKERIAELKQERKLERELDKDKGWER